MSSEMHKEKTMILISYTNNETISFKSVSTAKQYTFDLLQCDIHAVKIRVNNVSDFSGPVFVRLYPFTTYGAVTRKG